jgi:hypothetical protein
MRSFVLAVLLGCHSTFGADAESQDVARPFLDERAALTLFESRIRPALVKHCYSCHSAKTDLPKAGLRLDTREHALRGGETGPALVPGDLGASLLLDAISYEGDIQMPPSGKLPNDLIEDFRRWIASGAPDPRDGSAAEVAAAGQLWSLRPLQKPRVPTVSDPWIQTDIDRFIWEKLADKRLRPQPIVSRQILIRRAYFDLIGLPPTLGQIESFVKDDDPHAYENLVDELLKSSHYGERWGRHWLDVARYADSSGYEFDSDRAHAYHYRDFVIEAFNRDLPYDQFVRWQIAGDELAPENPLAHKATGFLAAGPMNSVVTAFDAEKERYNVLDDWVATIGTAMLGLTTGCARCHDHKFDPLPTEDYYRIAATFTTTVRVNRNIDRDPEATRLARGAFLERHTTLVAARDDFERTQMPDRASDCLADNPPATSPWLTVTAGRIKTAGDFADVVTQFQRRADGAYLVSEVNGELSSFTVELDTTLSDLRALKLEVLHDETLPRFGPGLGDLGDFQLLSVELTARPTHGASQEPVVAKLINPRTGTASGAPPSSEAGDNGGWSLTPQGLDDHWAIWDFEEPIGWPDGAHVQIKLRFANFGDYRRAFGCFRLSLAAGESTPDAESSSIDLADFAEARAALAVPAGKRTKPQQLALHRLAARYEPDWRRLDDAVQAHWRNRPWPQSETALVATEAKGLIPLRMANQGPDYYERTYLLRRGSVDQKGPEVKPGFLSAVTRASSPEAKWVATPSPGARTPHHRAAFAHWLTDVEGGAGHLLARVIVNRLWLHHFGQGLVTTPSDFGARGDRPVHPDLLDWLAAELIERQWSLKSLHQLIMTSAVYMQASTSSGSAATQAKTVDPANRLFWRQPLVRLQAEVIRDAMLAVSGRLDRTQFGPGTLDESMTRRSIYFAVKRSALIPTLVQLDWPNSLRGVGRRSVTTVAPQSLLLLNNPEVRANAEAFAERLLDQYQEWPDLVVQEAFVAAIGREPHEHELHVSLEFLRRQSASYESSVAPRAALTDYCQMLFGMNEFFYVQ